MSELLVAGQEERFYLIKYEQACRALAEATTVGEIKVVHDFSIRMRLYAKQSNNPAMTADAIVLRARAEHEIRLLMRAPRDTFGLSYGGLRGCCRKEAQVPRSTCEKTLSPKGATPGRLVAEKFEWLDTSVSRPRTTPPTAAPAKNGHDRVGPLLPLRLTEVEADRLTAYIATAAPRQVRDELMMSVELAQQAAARGVDLAPEIIGRITAFLAHPLRESRHAFSATRNT